MSPTTTATASHPLLATRVTIPPGVVYRSFVTETVVLNLETGRYHGLNPTAARMLDTLANTPSVAEAAGLLAFEYDRPYAEIEHDLCNFCQALIERGLLLIENP